MATGNLNVKLSAELIPPGPSPTKGPPFLMLNRRSWRCWLFGGCFFEWRRVDAWWERESCRWCKSHRDIRLSPAPRCGSCGREMPEVK